MKIGQLRILLDYTPRNLKIKGYPCTRSVLLKVDMQRIRAKVLLEQHSRSGPCAFPVRVTNPFFITRSDDVALGYA